MLQAADKIKELLEEADGDPHPPLTWLAAPAEPRALVPSTTNAYFDHLKDTSWEILATFHRGPNKAAKEAKENAPEGAVRGEF